MKSEILKKLEENGCDMKGAMSRFLDDEDMYLSFLENELNDSAFVTLQEGLSEKDVKKAFDSAHSLKGTLGNMGLTPLYNIVVKIVEPLRQGNMDGLMDDCEILIRERDSLKAKIGYE